MAGSAVRFLQVSDLDLHRPLCAISHVPAGLRQDIAEAPYLAAERVFDTAIAERVDFVLLAGNTCDPRHVGAPTTAMNFSWTSRSTFPKQ